MFCFSTKFFSEAFLKPAVLHIYTSLVNRWPLEYQLESSDRIEHFLTSCVHFVSLFFFENCATLIEDINGLRRVSFDEHTGRLVEPSLIQKILSFLFVCIPSRSAHFLPIQSPAFQKLQSYWNISVLFGSAANLILSTLYLLKKVSIHHPLFYLLKIRLVRRESSIQRSNGRSWQLSVILALILSIRAAEWFLNNDLSEDQLAKKIREKSLHVPPFPREKSLTVTEGAGAYCGLCRKNPVKPCISSGDYIFCYKCLLDHVQITSKCPVSNFPCSEKDVILLYT